MKNKKYYAVKTKCGHVGRKHYIPITFAIIAESGKDAAKKGRNLPRVKHDHKDAILSVAEITYDEYLVLSEENHNNVYLQCKNKQEQNNYCRNLKELLIEDDHNKKICYSKKERQDRIAYKQKKLKTLLDSYKNYDYAYSII